MVIPSRAAPADAHTRAERSQITGSIARRMPPVSRCTQNLCRIPAITPSWVLFCARPAAFTPCNCVPIRSPPIERIIGFQIHIGALGQVVIGDQLKLPRRAVHRLGVAVLQRAPHVSGEVPRSGLLRNATENHPALLEVGVFQCSESRRGERSIGKSGEALVVLIDDITQRKTRLVPRVRTSDGPCLGVAAVDRVLRLLERATEREWAVCRHVGCCHAKLAAVCHVAGVAAERIRGRNAEVLVLAVILDLVAAPDATGHGHFGLEVEVIRNPWIAGVPPPW